MRATQGDAVTVLQGELAVLEQASAVGAVGMERSQIKELHYITDMANIPSMLEQGILCHRLAARTAQGHVSVADEEVQARRAGKRIWLGRYYRRLHDYANLYIDARNAMLFLLLQAGQGDLTVLAIDPKVLDLRGVVIADRNAASLAPRFLPSAQGIEALDEAVVTAKRWTDSQEAKQRRMAEVLVPGRVPPSLIRGAYVPDEDAAQRLQGQLGGRSLAIRVHPRLFFRGRP
jgi:ssDNA thymidine ADP-ribosyltransferase, DarT